ncbi:MAG: tyrosine-type recombinase/integrase [Eubacteriales bacterium]|nr:tyrosine-type recombinase/integrase [Eubacteriales bacterium]
MKLIEDTPFKKTLLRINAESAGHHKPLPNMEVDRIKTAIPSLENEEERLYMGLLVYTGMRVEEILGLMWEDVYISECYLTVRQAVTHPTNGKYHIDTPKSRNSYRTAGLTIPLMTIIRPLVKESGYIIGGAQPSSYSKKS